MLFVHEYFIHFQENSVNIFVESLSKIMYLPSEDFTDYVWMFPTLDNDFLFNLSICVRG